MQPRNFETKQPRNFETKKPIIFETKKPKTKMPPESLDLLSQDLGGLKIAFKCYEFALNCKFEVISN